MLTTVIPNAYLKWIIRKPMIRLSRLIKHLNNFQTQVQQPIYPLLSRSRDQTKSAPLQNCYRKEVVRTAVYLGMYLGSVYA